MEEDVAGQLSGALPSCFLGVLSLARTQRWTGLITHAGCAKGLLLLLLLLLLQPLVVVVVVVRGRARFQVCRVSECSGLAGCRISPAPCLKNG